jgi:hypothetical protein
MFGSFDIVDASTTSKVVSWCAGHVVACPDREAGRSFSMATVGTFATHVVTCAVSSDLDMTSNDHTIDESNAQYVAYSGIPDPTNIPTLCTRSLRLDGRARSVESPYRATSPPSRTAPPVSCLRVITLQGSLGIVTSVGSNVDDALEIIQ